MPVAIKKEKRKKLVSKIKNKVFVGLIRLRVVVVSWEDTG
jgi:hypothetical protein